MSLRFLFTAIVSFLFISCSPENSKIVIAEFNNDKITMEEFEKAYCWWIGSSLKR
ncbi:MAG: hypothetical protein MUF28_03715 [Ignavibacterium sp.]|nr:hypothetical protein [Ignavibacterium sp.]